MAITNNAGFSTREGASLSTELGQAISIQLARLVQHLRAPSALRDDRLGGPGFDDLVPNLAGESKRR